jgi:hypothetical protein
MSNFTIYHTNKIDSAQLGGGSWQATLPLANLYVPAMTRRARSVDTQLASTQFTVAMAEPLTALGIQIIATNLSSAAQYKLSWYSDSAFTSLIDTTGFIAVGSSIDWTNVLQWFDWLDANFWLGAQPFLDPDNQGRDIRHHFTIPTSVQYLKVEFDDTTNAEGFVELGYIFIGQPFVSSVNVAPDASFARMSLTSMQETVGGSQYFNRRASRRRLAVTWPLLPKEEIFGEIDEIIEIHDIDRPVFVDLDPDSTSDSGRKTAFLARIERMPEAKLLQAFIDSDTGAAIGFEFIQVL